jgi:chitin disaccharide deacetylase
VVLCADDFGLTQGVSEGILELCHSGRLSATGAMTNRPWWPRLAAELRAFEGRVAVGLHLNLSTGNPLGPMPRFAPHGRLPPFEATLGRALAGRLPQDEVAAEIARQVAAFVEGFGRPPDFVDGHQHVHVLPGVRGALLRVLDRLPRPPGFWLRDPSERVAAIVKRGVSVRKALIVRALAAGLRRAARRRGIDTNEGFSGFSPFDQTLAAEVERLFERSFDRLGRRPVVMCHPGRPDAELATLDPVVEARGHELAYLASPAFGALLAQRDIVLARRPLAPGAA